ncbi:MAG: DUF2336 domain-containing protein [Rhodospirillales bacterium]|nr:DUF2336 domain-containing protein [Rhodospirillales bacterium]
MQPQSLIERLQAIIDRLGKEATGDRHEAVGELAEFVAAIGAEGPATRFQILAVELVRAIIREIETPLRRLVAERLSHDPGVSKSVLRVLANDEIEVAWPVLTASQALGEADLIAIASSSSQAHRTAIAGRADVTLALSQCLASFGELDVLRALLSNESARISRETFAVVADLARGWPELHDPLSRRADLPAVIAYEMLGWIAEALHGFLFKRLSVDPGALRAVIAGAAEEAASRMEADGRLFPLLDGMLGGWGTWPDDRVVGFLELVRAGRGDLFEVALAQHLGEPLRLVRRACRGGEFADLALMSRARDMGRVTFAAMLDALSAEAPAAVEEGLRAFDNLTVAQAKAARSMRPEW